ncbi:antitoxin VapB family protein [Desulfobacula sp.]|jgi:predicted CopG family antitoxin|uniref:antitoxin VapB family protein n=1 Tax=Desulfobacula sp. TaxID=2593537 RepID=UPI0026238325|nr:antitoxin VapB family protein [Desulfobacula sp.]
MKTVSIRGVEPEVAEKLKIVARKQGKSVNNLILEFIKISLGFNKEKKFSRRYDDLDNLFGRWSDDEFKKINDSITRQRKIDQDLWE